MSRVGQYEFIKVEQRLLNDPRFYMLTEFEQLLYIKLLSLMKQTKNQIPKNYEAIKLYSRTNRSTTEVESAVNRLSEIFDNLKQNKYFWFFDGYESRYHNKTFNKCTDKDLDKDLDKDKEHLVVDSLLTAKKELSKIAKPETIAKWITKLTPYQQNDLRLFISRRYSDGDAAWGKAESIYQKEARNEP